MPVFGLSHQLKSKYRHFLFFIFLGFFGSNTLAQQPPSLRDSLAALLHYQPQLTGSFNTRGSFIDGRVANVREVAVGMVFHEKLTLGVGYHWLKTERKKTIFEDTLPLDTELKMRYLSLNIFYTFYHKTKWYISIPAEIGLGTSFRQGEGKKGYQRQSILLYEPVMLAEYRVMRYFGIAGGIGFRLMLKNNHFLNEQFNSPIYVLRLKIRFSEFF